MKLPYTVILVFSSFLVSVSFSVNRLDINFSFTHVDCFSDWCLKPWRCTFGILTSLYEKITLLKGWEQVTKFFSFWIFLVVVLYWFLLCSSQPVLMVVTCFWILQFSIFRKWSYRRKLDGELEDAEQKVSKLGRQITTCVSCLWYKNRQLMGKENDGTHGDSNDAGKKLWVDNINADSGFPEAEYPGDDIPGAGAGAVTTKLSQGVTREAPETSIGMVEGTTTATAVLPPEPVPSGFTAERSPLQEDTLLLFFSPFSFLSHCEIMI